MPDGDGLVGGNLVGGNVTELRSARTQVVQEPYTLALHPKLAELSDLLAQQCQQELFKNGCKTRDISFSVKLHMCAVSGGPTILIDAVHFDPRYDFDAEVTRWENSTSTGYQRFSEMPADVPFRVNGKSQGYFVGLWIGLGFKQALEQQSGIKLGRADVAAIVEAITVEAWAPDNRSPKSGVALLLTRARWTARRFLDSQWQQILPRHPD